MTVDIKGGVGFVPIRFDGLPIADGYRLYEEVCGKLFPLDLDAAKKQDNKVMIGRLTKFLEDLPQEDSIDQSILDLEQRIFAAVKPEKIKVSLASAGSSRGQPAKNPTP